jgi:hypothetical protein
MARKPTEEAISTWKTRKQMLADAKTNGTTNLLFIVSSLQPAIWVQSKLVPSG